MEQLEGKAMNFMETLTLRFQEALDLQMAVNNSHMENQNRIMMDFMTEMLRRIASLEERIIALQCGMPQNQEVEEEADGQGDGAEGDEDDFNAPASPADVIYPDPTSSADIIQFNDVGIELQQFIIAEEDEVENDWFAES